jgi:NAD+ kinase
MAKIIHNVAIITKINNIEAESAAKRIAKLLTKKKIQVYTIFPLTLGNSAMTTDSENLRNIDLDLAFAIGGDGTTLRAFRTIPHNVPIFSVNAGGHRGILSEISLDSIDTIDTAIELLLAGQYFYDFRVKIQAAINGNIIPAALNDIVFTRINLTRTPMISMKLMDDEISQRMDGVIISTPTGSTGHSYSIGGPVLYEGLNCLIINPIASVDRMPEIVVPTATIEIKITYDAELIVDGQEIYEVPAGQSVQIFRSSTDAQFIRIRKRGIKQIAKLGF